ncbi:MAG: DUF3574 domain-containing protein [Luteimonas sp.]|nr:DUF3574 domain-containing protein [Luteimonas sp.]
MRQILCMGRHTMLLATLLAISGCATQPLHGRLAAPACEAGDQAMVRDTLYFGRNRPDGGTVGDAEWRGFLDEVVTPRFPDGLTVTHATGQWRGASGAVEQEASEVVTLLHAGDAAARGKVAEIATEYKRRFHQEAVLRERTGACASF